MHLAVSYPQHFEALWPTMQKELNVNGSYCHAAPDVIQPWDNLPRSFSSLHGGFAGSNPCRACEAQWSVGGFKLV